MGRHRRRSKGLSPLKMHLQLAQYGAAHRVCQQDRAWLSEKKNLFYTFIPCFTNHGYPSVEVECSCGHLSMTGLLQRWHSEDTRPPLRDAVLMQWSSSLPEPTMEPQKMALPCLSMFYVLSSSTIPAKSILLQ